MLRFIRADANLISLIHTHQKSTVSNSLFYNIHFIVRLYAKLICIEILEIHSFPSLKKKNYRYEKKDTNLYQNYNNIIITI